MEKKKKKLEEDQIVDPNQLELFDEEVVVKFQDNFRRDHSQDGEITDPVSMTIPDQSLSIPELMERYARGLPLNQAAHWFEFDGEDEDAENFPMPDIDNLDLAEVQALKMQADEDVARLRQELQDLQKKGQEKANEELQKQKYKEMLAARRGSRLMEMAEDQMSEDKEFLAEDQKSQKKPASDAGK